MTIRISADSTCDLSKEYIEAHGITMLPLTVSMGDRDYIDGQDIAPDDIFRHVDAGGSLPKTAAINTAAYRKRFKALLEGCDDAQQFVGVARVGNHQHKVVGHNHAHVAVHGIESADIDRRCAGAAERGCNLGTHVAALSHTRHHDMALALKQQLDGTVEVFVNQGYHVEQRLCLVTETILCDGMNVCHDWFYFEEPPVSCSEGTAQDFTIL